ncbi:MAG: baseplate multidomain protein megatron [Parvibaculales bacterium]
MSNLAVTLGSAATQGGGDILVSLALEQLAASSLPDRERGRLSEFQFLTTRAGASITRLFGTGRLGGQLIWVDDVREHATTERGGAKGNNQPEVRDYHYTVSFAIAICEGVIGAVGRIWVDGKELDLTKTQYHFHGGSQSQEPSGVMEAVLGEGNVPAYKGICYIVFEDMNITAFGNRIPQFNFEVTRKKDHVSSNIRAVNMLPGATEFGYDPNIQLRILGAGHAVPENIHASPTKSDWTVSLDALQAQCPDCEMVALVVTWFGNDLRASHCQIRPGVENREKITYPDSWAVGGYSRDNAYLISDIEGRSAFGGTPSDESVTRAIQDLKRRGIGVLFYPFIMMDIPSDNNLPHPRNPAWTQPAYPWRGEIERVSGNDREAENLAFMNNGFSEMINHYSDLCAEAGGVDAFLIGSELRGLTKDYSPEEDAIFTDELVDMLFYMRKRLVKYKEKGTISELPKISYAADWSEYGGFVPQEEPDSLYFPLDVIWAYRDIDFVAIDNYLPMSDWRDGKAHKDYLKGYSSIRSQRYLKDNIEGGEYYDWYYRNEKDREQQKRSSIQDGARGEDWVYRAKDIKSWWSNKHRERRGDRYNIERTDWVPEEKPIWFTEAGCPAIDKGTNQPNVFFDPKSSSSSLPHFSSGERDDDIQRQYIRAIGEYWDLASPHNPQSHYYDTPMVEKIFFWAWDARPYPTFPLAEEIWSDGPNWARGHWLTGRLGGSSLADLVEELGEGAVAPEASAALEGALEGYILSDIVSPREAIEPLMQAFGFSAITDGAGLRFAHFGSSEPVTIPMKELCVEEGEPVLHWVREAEKTIPSVIKLSFLDPHRDYEPNMVEARREAARENIKTMSLPIIMPKSDMQSIAERILYEAHMAGEQLRILLPPSYIHLENGDIIRFSGENAPLGTWRIIRITDTNMRELILLRHSPSIYRRKYFHDSQKEGVNIPEIGSIPLTHFLDIPLSVYTDNPSAPYAAAFSNPWTDKMQIETLSEGLAPVLRAELAASCTIGKTLTQLERGEIAMMDYANILELELYGGELYGVSKEAMVNGANLAAIGDGSYWELFHFQQAELIAAKQYRLSFFLRGILGSDADMPDTHPIGSHFVLLNEHIAQLRFSLYEPISELSLHYGPAIQGSGGYGWGSQIGRFSGKALRPFSPVHLSVKRLDSQDIRFSWIRRSRINGDIWQGVDVPLGEESEQYLIRISFGDRVLKEVQSTTPYYIYTAQELATENIPENSSLSFAVAQLSQVYGSGAFRNIQFII